MKKTGWTNFLACFLAFSAISGAGNIYVMLLDQQWQARVLAVCVTIYVAITVPAAYSLFAAKIWSQKAVGVWAIALISLIVPMQFWIVGAPILHVSIMVAITSFILFKIYKYIGRCTHAH